MAEALDLPPEELTPESKSEDFSQWDSLGHLRVCMAIEEHLGVTIEMSKMRQTIARRMAIILTRPDSYVKDAQKFPTQ